MRTPIPYLIICIISFIFLPNILQAQPQCGFDKLHRRMEQESPLYQQQVQKHNQQLRQWLQQKEEADRLSTDGRVLNGAETIYEIPVVVHVIHTGDVVGTDYNPGDAQLLGMIDYLNQSFQATWAGYPADGTGGTRVPFRFVLAQRAPDCTPTTGIVRVNGSSIPNYTANGVRVETPTGTTDVQVKALSLWPANQYYNIWVVNKIDSKDGYPGTVGSFIAGFAYFPGAPTSMDGTVMLASQAKAGQKTLPHELGHAFSLYHTFQGGAGAACPTNGNCSTDGDMVCDTDPTNESAFFTCPSAVAINPCTGTVWNGQQNNFMHYTNCGAFRFTPGQRDRMIATVNTIRGGLLTSAALQPPPAQLASAATCAPAGIANAGNPYDMGPVRIQLNTLDDSTNSYSTDGKFYEDHTCNMSTTLTEGQTYTLNISTRSNQQVAKAWIDYNNNGTFEAGEQIMNSSTPGGLPDNSYVHTVQVIIPTGATQGSPLRLRILADFISNGSIAACGNQQYGQTEDYSVTVVPSGTLPVKIYDERIALLNNTVRFSFRAGDEDHVKTYELQRAGKEGQGFATIRTVLPGDLRISANEYSVTDDAPTGDAGWYRILATEKDGRKFYSRILGTPTSTDVAGSIRIFPNPTKGNINISLPLPSGTAVQLMLSDARGRIVWTGTRAAGKPITIGGNFPAGMYYLTAIAGQYKWNSKVIVTGK